MERWVEEQKRAGKTGSVSSRGGGEAESEPPERYCGELGVPNFTLYYSLTLLP